MAYDQATGTMVLFGGNANTGLPDDTWTWDGSTWTQVFPPTSPPGRVMPTMAYDLGTGNIVLFGGLGVVRDNDTDLSDTWTWG
jgi:hypothetical protein